MRNITRFFLTLVIIFVVLACVNMLFEYFDTGDDPLYGKKAAAKNLVMALVLSGTIVFMNRKNTS